MRSGRSRCSVPCGRRHQLRYCFATILGNVAGQIRDRCKPAVRFTTTFRLSFKSGSWSWESIATIVVSFSPSWVENTGKLNMLAVLFISADPPSPGE